MAVTPSPPDENPYYLQAITELGDQQEIVAHSDIYAANGMKLLAKGAKINRDKYLRLIEHKLKVSIDASLSLESTVDAEALALYAGKLLAGDGLIKRMAPRTGDPLAARHELARLELPFPVPTRLAVMRGSRPKLYHHTLRVTMIAFFLGQRLRISANDMPILLQAALCHDLGELHTDPALLAPDHVISPDERRYVHVHPVTGHLLLGEVKGLSPMVAKIVLQHHERLDGSGYPYGLMADKIAPLSKILALAEVAEAVLERYEPERLDMLLRVGRIRFDRSALDALRDLIELPNGASNAKTVDSDFSREVERLAQALHSWQLVGTFLETQCGGDTAKSSTSFIFARMQAIRGLIIQAGFDPNDIDKMVDTTAMDPEISAELQNMLHEIDWLLNDLVNEFDRRAPGLDDLSKAALEELLHPYRLQYWLF